MEQPREQFEIWPEKKKDLTIEEINKLSRKAGNYGQRKKEDLVSKKETTEGEGKVPADVSPFEENKKRVQDLLKYLKEKELKEKDGDIKKEGNHD